jgi:DNA-binding transcriptional ArsR family regulator
VKKGVSDQDKLREEVNMLREQIARIAEQLEKKAEEPKVEEPEEPEIEEPEEVEIPFEEEPFDFDKEERRNRRNRRNERYGRLYGEIYGRAWRPNEPWGEKLGEYIGEFVNDVMENVNTELEQTLFIDTDRKRGKPTMMSDRDVQRTSAIMSAMGNEHRITILKELSWGGMYSSDLQEALKEISPSTLSSHLDVLEQVGLIHQEKRRGRYIITMTGRIAIRMAAQIAKRADVKLDFE